VSTARAEQTEARRHPLVIDLDGVDLGGRVAGVEQIERTNPHRHEMRLLDAVVWMAEDFSGIIGLHFPQPDAFWVRGHFPGRATMPGVLMVEAGAQLASYMWNSRNQSPRVAAFLRIDGCSFRRAVVPGETLVLLCREMKYSSRRFISHIQGVVDGNLAFDAQISGLAMEPHSGG
jgi:3-hydroxyacyl-[acyl-carrier-protein] dehydratase